MWVVYAILAVVVLGLAVMTLCTMRYRRLKREMIVAIKTVELEQIPQLSQECMEVFKERAGVTLDMDKPLECAQVLDEYILSWNIMNFFLRQKCTAILSNLREHFSGN